jgi:hypothetical protein
MNYSSKKSLFKYIQSKKYQIKKHNEFNNILFINFDTFKIKCKYFLLFSVINNNGNKLLWSCENPYCNIESFELCNKIYGKYNKYLKDIEFLNKDELKLKISEIIKMIIKNFENIQLKNKTYNLLWIIEDRKNNYSSFYVITEIIYF